ncbi:MAG: 2-oxoacid:acceptor oxidoreductase family protein [Bdellovibrionota bacterium]
MSTTTSNDQVIAFPGIRTTADGSSAVAWVETHICTGAAAYPITPSTNMGVAFQQAVADGMSNLWGDKLVFFEPESEHSAASVCEGYALAGGRVTNFTAGQGLVLMKEVLYTIAGKRLPIVFNIGARALTVHALNVHAGHDDVMAVADCGWGMLFARNAQEAADLCLIARRTAEESHVPFLNIQDGFLTTHTVETMCLPEPELMKIYLKPPNEILHNLMDPENPVMSGTVQNQDAYMRGKIAQRSFYGPLRGNLKRNFAELSKLTGRKLDLIETYRMEDAEFAIVGMGSFMETARSTVDWLRRERQEKVGLISVISYRPFPAEEIVEALKKVKAVSILERLDDACAPENPLARDIKAAFADALWGRDGYPKLSKIPVIQHGAGGLGGRDVRAGDFIAIVENMKALERGKTSYCVGIKHHDALVCQGKDDKEPDIRPKGSFSVRGHSIGGYGSVTTSKIIASVCGDLFDLNVQAFPRYGAEKKGLPTTYYITVAPKPIAFHQELRQVDLVFLNDMSDFLRASPLEGLSSGGILVLQGRKCPPKDVWLGFPEKAKKTINDKKIKVYSVDTLSIVREVVKTPDLVQRMQGIVLLGVFLKVTPMAMERSLSRNQLMVNVEKAVRKYFGKRGEQVVHDNLVCVRRGYDEVMEIPTA